MMATIRAQSGRSRELAVGSVRETMEGLCSTFGTWTISTVRGLATTWQMDGKSEIGWDWRGNIAVNHAAESHRREGGVQPRSWHLIESSLSPLISLSHLGFPSFLRTFWSQNVLGWEMEESIFS